MKQEQLMSAYDQFFNKSEEGKHFMLAVDEIIDSAHRLAENDPVFARDNVQRAKGAREVLKHIQSVTTLIKKGKTI